MLYKLQQFAPITGADARSFAHFTIKNRLPEILRKVRGENDLDTDGRAGIAKLENDLLRGTLYRFATGQPDDDRWDAWVLPHEGCTFFEAPFYFVEAYFYRRVAAAVSYFSAETAPKRDPFLYTKLSDIRKNHDFFSEQMAHLASSSQREIDNFLLNSLWGNRADLSQLPASARNESPLTHKALLVNDAPEASGLIQQAGIIDMVLDNAGVELFTDLLLCHHLLRQGSARRIRLHVKPYPTFVSDAVEHDVHLLLQVLVENHDGAVRDWAASVQKMVHEGAVQIVSSAIWNWPLHFYALTAEMNTLMPDSDFIIFKGDANYRRLLGDRQVPMDAQAKALINYLPVPALALRTLKSEIACGLSEDLVMQLHSQQPEWMTNGRFGMMQMVN
jgi:uncharacterized protein with ATP-grasp and redox domains